MTWCGAVGAPRKHTYHGPHHHFRGCGSGHLCLYRPHPPQALEQAEAALRQGLQVDKSVEPLQLETFKLADFFSFYRLPPNRGPAAPPCRCAITLDLGHGVEGCCARALHWQEDACCSGGRWLGERFQRLGNSVVSAQGFGVTCPGSLLGHGSNRRLGVNRFGKFDAGIAIRSGQTRPGCSVSNHFNPASLVPVISKSQSISAACLVPRLMPGAASCMRMRWQGRGSRTTSIRDCIVDTCPIVHAFCWVGAPEVAFLHRLTPPPS